MTRHAKMMGLYQDPQLSGYLEKIIEVFYGEGIDVAIIPENLSDVAFRGIADRKWLRIKPEQIRAMYGPTTTMHWVIVGQVTVSPYRPNIGETSTIQSVTDSLPPAVNSSEEAVQQRGIRDAYRKMILSLRNMEKVFFEGFERSEVWIRPLAIYYELEIEVEAD